jgi:hypothetical protein
LRAVAVTASRGGELASKPKAPVPSGVVTAMSIKIEENGVV